jgi:hypothetical protein
MRLSDEHLVARCLGGVSILPDASCLDCAKITSYIEGYCANNIFGTLRVQRGLPTRRPQNRPSALPITFDIEGRFFEHMVHPKQSISSFIMPRLPPPGILRGQLPSNKFDYVQENLVWTIANPFLHHSYAAKVGARGAFSYGKRNSPYIFGRMLAKIAHAYCSGQGQLDGFTPLLPDIILGTSDKIPYVIGNTEADEPPEKIPLGTYSRHRMRLGIMTMPPKQVCFVHIRLFSFLKTPTYTVIAGERTLPAQS